MEVDNLARPQLGVGGEAHLARATVVIVVTTATLLRHATRPVRSEGFSQRGG